MLDFILETNVINLSIVIFILYTYGTDTVTEALDARRERIVQTLSIADKKYEEAKQKIEKAKAAVKFAQSRREEVLNALPAKRAFEEKRIADQLEFERTLLQEKAKANIQVQTDRTIRGVLQKVGTKLLRRALASSSTTFFNNRNNVRIYQNLLVIHMIHNVNEPIGCVSAYVKSERRFIPAEKEMAYLAERYSNRYYRQKTVYDRSHKWATSHNAIFGS